MVDCRAQPSDQLATELNGQFAGLHQSVHHSTCLIRPLRFFAITPFQFGEGFPVDDPLSVDGNPQQVLPPARRAGFSLVREVGTEHGKMHSHRQNAKTGSRLRRRDQTLTGKREAVDRKRRSRNRANRLQRDGSHRKPAHFSPDQRSWEPALSP